jgi:hypothetical protein
MISTTAVTHYSEDYYIHYADGTRHRVIVQWPSGASFHVWQKRLHDTSAANIRYVEKIRWLLLERLARHLREFNALKADIVKDRTGPFSLTGMQSRVYGAPRAGKLDPYAHRPVSVRFEDGSFSFIYGGALPPDALPYDARVSKLLELHEDVVTIYGRLASVNTLLMSLFESRSRDRYNRRDRRPYQCHFRVNGRDYCVPSNARNSGDVFELWPLPFEEPTPTCDIDAEFASHQ